MLQSGKRDTWYALAALLYNSSTGYSFSTVRIILYSCCSSTIVDKIVVLDVGVGVEGLEHGPASRPVVGDVVAPDDGVVARAVERDAEPTVVVLHL